MHRILAATFALPMLLGAGAAFADQVIGTVQKLEPERRAVWINDTPYLLEEQAAPLKFQDIAVGDKLRLEFTASGDGNYVSEADKAK